MIINRHIPWITVLALALFTFASKEVTLSGDMKEYMSYAMSLYAGNGYVATNGSELYFRAPLFPFFILLSYWAFDISLSSAFVVVRFFCIANPIIIYFLGKRLFNSWVGFVSALLALTSYAINWASFRHLDAIWPTFALLSLLFTCRYCETHKRTHIILAGVFIGTSYWVKQGALLLFPLPALVLLCTNSLNRKTCMDIFWYGVALSLVVLPWIGYVYGNTLNWRLAVIGTGHNHISGAPQAQEGISFLFTFFKGLHHFFLGDANSLMRHFILWPVMLMGWSFCFYNAFRRKAPYVTCALAFVLLSPYMSNVGIGHLRLGHLVLFYLLTCIVTAALLFSIHSAGTTFLAKRISTRPTTAAWGVGLALVTPLLCINIFVSYSDYKPNTLFLAQSSAKRPQVITNPVLKTFLSQIEPLIQKESGIAIDYKGLGRSIYIEQNGEHTIYDLPFVWINPISGLSSSPRYPINKTEAPVYIASNGQPSSRSFRLIALYHSHLLEMMTLNHLNYVVTSYRWRNLKDALLESPYFELVHELEGNHSGFVEKYYLFKHVNTSTPPPRLERHIHPTAQKMLKRLKKKWPQKYAEYEQAYRSATGRLLF